MHMPSRISLVLNISRPRMIIIPSPFLTPTISAASTAIQAAKKLIRSMVKTCGSTAGNITRVQPCARDAPKLRAVLNDHHPEPVFDADHFGRQHRHPGREEIDPQHGENVRQHRRKYHPRPAVCARRAEAARGLE